MMRCAMQEDVLVIASQNAALISQRQREQWQLMHPLMLLWDYVCTILSSLLTCTKSIVTSSMSIKDQVSMHMTLLSPLACGHKEQAHTCEATVSWVKGFLYRRPLNSKAPSNRSPFISFRLLSGNSFNRRSKTRACVSCSTLQSVRERERA